MAIKLTDICNKESGLAPGHRLCAGCGEPIVVRQVLYAIDEPVVVCNPTGCLEVGTTPFPFTSWRVPWVHNAFENSASTISGVETAYRSLVKQGKMPDKPIKFVIFGGDGATYDIGLQFLSGALERNHKFLYVCLNNEAYMNTGIQRSGATPLGTWTTTTPVGAVYKGKQQPRKDMSAIAAAHNIPYVAQAAPHAWRDLMTKVQKAVAADGASFINVLTPCPRGWRHASDDTIAMSQLGTECGVWPLYEIDHGQYRITQRPSNRKPITEWIKSQGRFTHLLRPENEHVIAEMQRALDAEWDRLEKMEKITQN